MNALVALILNLYVDPTKCYYPEKLEIF